MRQALAILSTLILCASGALPAAASDWEEEDARQSSTLPPTAPPAYPRRPLPAYGGNSGWPAPAADQDRTSFNVVPKGNGQQGPSGAPLEATVSKWGAGGQLNNDNLTGAAGTVPTGGFFFQLAAQKAVPPSTFRAWIEKANPQFALSTSTMDPMNVLEVKGQWDDADRTLRAFGVRHTTIKGKMLAKTPLDDVRVIVVNCAGNVPGEAYQLIRDFVARGGFLISTDWTVHNLLEHSFPGYVSWNGGKTDNKVVDATVVDPDPVLFHGTVRYSGWKLDDGSQMIRVLRPDVRILVRSRQLSNEDPDHQGILAVTFPFGRGHVLHLVGHFDNNATLAFGNLLPDPNPEIGISLRQALAGNFLVAGMSPQGKGRPPD